jgi:hypothetical protein
VIHIILNDEQAKVILESTGCVEIRDSSGKHLGFVAQGFSSEDVAIAQQRLSSDEPRHTTRQVLDHLQSLDEK